MRKRKRAFTVKSGGRIPRDKVQIYGETLYGLSEEVELLTPEYILKNAKRKASPLHDFFTWDDTKAAERYRLYEAGCLMRWIEVDVQYEAAADNVKTKAFMYVDVVRDDGQKTKGFATIEEISANDEYLDYIIEAAHRELITWRNNHKKYLNIKSFKNTFGPVFKSVEALNKKKAVAA